MRYPRNAKIFRGQLDAAPFAGVFFCLLIFLLLNSSLVFSPGVKIDLATANDLPGHVGPSVVVAVDASGALIYRNRIISESELKEDLRGEVLRARSGQEELMLVALLDRDVNSQTLVRLAQLAKQAGIQQVLQATRPQFESAETAPPAPTPAP